MPDARLWLSSRCLSSSSEETIPVMYSFDDVHILKFDGSQSDKKTKYINLKRFILSSTQYLYSLYLLSIIEERYVYIYKHQLIHSDWVSTKINHGLL